MALTATRETAAATARPTSASTTPTRAARSARQASTHARRSMPGICRATVHRPACALASSWRTNPPS
ncbi:hypothetical protein PUR61_16585 [Streptomyces sp. BE20]|uniref:hypothetical protein n=1 Tax=Streptomyces sp. BE20 TaxID=3002525 RepID=UPI002E79CEE4|nr:hypothetical protein [Streptomyces sp. BE20]MEE1823796.1 hypothetical protein [Streptomyces sp. BE20]